MSYEMYKCIEIDKKIIVVHVIQVIAKRIIHNEIISTQHHLYTQSNNKIEDRIVSTWLS